MNVVSHRANAMTMTLTMKRMRSTLAERRGRAKGYGGKRDRTGAAGRERSAPPRDRRPSPVPAGAPRARRRLQAVEQREPVRSACPVSSRPSPRARTRSTATPTPRRSPLRERLAERFGVDQRRGARRRGLGVDPRAVHHRGGGARRRGRLRLALVRGLPGARHRRRCDERAGAATDPTTATT